MQRYEKNTNHIVIIVKKVKLSVKIRVVPVFFPMPSGTEVSANEYFLTVHDVYSFAQLRTMCHIRFSSINRIAAAHIC